MKKLFLFLAIAINISVTYSQEVTGDTLMKINALFKKWDSDKTPGAVMAISRNGKIIYNRAWGMADIENQVPNTTSTIFDIASISKQFTAAAVLLLEEQKKLSLDDDIRKYLPELQKFSSPVSIRNLTSHTSGLYEWRSLFALTGRERTDFDNQYVLKLLSKQKDLMHKPGDEFNYTNSNYILLALIVERVSGMQFPDFCKKFIFEPLGLQNTQWKGFNTSPAKAFGYVNANDSFRKNNSTVRVQVLGHGNLQTTTSDLVKWNHKYLSGQLAGPVLLKKQLRQAILNNGVMIPYASGINVMTYKGHKTISHDGVGTGYTSFIEYYPEYDMSFVLLSNASNLNAPQICRQVEDIFISPETSNVKIENYPVIALSSGYLAHFEGWYKNIRTSAGLLLTVKNNLLLSNNGDTLYPVSPKKFRMQRNFIEFTDSTRSTARLTSSFIYPDTIMYNPVPPAQNDPIKLNEYTGKYFCDEIETTAVVIMREGALYLHLPPERTYRLKGLYKDGFSTEPFIIGGQPNYIYFERNADGIITGINFSMHRTRNIFFKKSG